MPADSRPTLLVVDDNPATRYSTSRVLRSADFEVLEAATGREALALAAQRPDLVVLDINLPDIDGFEVCRTLRRQPRPRTSRSCTCRPPSSTTSTRCTASRPAPTAT